MERAEFVNDLCCNYLTVPYEGEENDFALRMIMENVTDVFLPVELRRLNGENYLYYNISGLQNMEILYAEKPIDRKAFRMLMWQLHEAVEESRELFLPGDGICLKPSFLFWNMRKERWEFVYVPGREKREIEEIQREREEFAEFLVMHIDYEDKSLTDTVYRFYEEICSGKINPGYFEPEETKESETAWGESAEEMKGVEAAWEVREEKRGRFGSIWKTSGQKEEIEDMESLDVNSGEIENSKVKWRGADKKANKENQDVERLNIGWAGEENYNIGISEKDRAEIDEFEINESDKGKTGKKIKPKKTAGIKILQIIVCIFFCTAAVITVLAGRIAPDMRMPGAATTVLLAALLFHIHRKRKSMAADEFSETEDIIYTETGEIPYGVGAEVSVEQEKVPEETVYMDIKQEQERKLYGIGKFRQQKIFLDKLPCLIGKDNSLVNHTISDASISRMHARFFEENCSLWLQDLNSKNGTYHNGLRLRPNEKVMLEAEDEIGFGRVQFVFR